MIAEALKARYGEPWLALGPLSLWVHRRLPMSEYCDGNLLEASACLETPGGELWDDDGLGVDLDDLPKWVASLTGLLDGAQAPAKLSLGDVWLIIFQSGEAELTLNAGFHRMAEGENWHTCEMQLRLTLEELRHLIAALTELRAEQPIVHGWQPPWGDTLKFTRHVGEQQGWECANGSGQTDD